MAKIVVNIIESERGWGSRVDEVKEFPIDKMQEALDFVEKFNEQNNSDTVPDWYMYAEKPKVVN